MRDVVIGIDIGTSSAKIIVCDITSATSTNFEVIASASAEYSPDRPAEGWSQQEAHVWWNATCKACQSLAPLLRDCNIHGIATTGQMHGAVCFGKEAVTTNHGTATPLTPVILWNDVRSAPQCRYLEKAAGGALELVQTTGLASRPGFTFPKLLWIRENLPRVWEKLACFCLPKDYINYRMCGQLRTDDGEASGTGLYNVLSRSWSREVLEWFDLPGSLCPSSVLPNQTIGELLPAAATELGIIWKPGIKVICGSGDNQCGAIGAGIVNPGDTAAILGTSGVLLTLLDTPLLDVSNPDSPGRLHTFAAWRDRWCMTGCTLAAGDALAWAKRLLAPNISYDDIFGMAASISPGCDGLMFLPHLGGERCPYPSATARGAWVGLSHNHTIPHMLRSVIEGVSLTFGHIAEIMRENGAKLTSATACGGGHASPLWRRLQSDCMNITLHDVAGVEESHMTARGAAVLAAVGAGVVNSIEDSAHELKLVSTQSGGTEPKDQDHWKQLRDRHAHAYQSLSPWFSSASKPVTHRIET